jgi:hypothetical protein
MAIVYKNGINVSPPTTMTHSKRFGTVSAENLTSAHPSRGLETCGIARKIGNGCLMMNSGKPLPIDQR